MNLISVMKLMQSFQWVAFRSNQSTLPCKCIGFEGDFYTYLSGFVGRDIKQLCIWGSHIKYFSSCCIGPYYVESCIFIIYIFFLIVVSLKEIFTGNAVQYWNKYVFVTNWDKNMGNRLSNSRKSVFDCSQKLLWESRKFLFLYLLFEKVLGPMSSKVDVMKFC